MSQLEKLAYYSKALFDGDCKAQVAVIGKFEQELTLHDTPEYPDLLEKILKHSMYELVVLTTIRLIGYVNDLDRQASLLEIVLLRTEIKVIRSHIALQLGKLKRMRSVDALVLALNSDPDSEVRTFASFALCQYKNREINLKILDSLPSQKKSIVISGIFIGLAGQRTKKIVYRIKRFLARLPKNTKESFDLVKVAYDLFGKKVIPSNYHVIKGTLEEIDQYAKAV